MAEKYYDISPYAYAGDNPVNNIDMNGDSISVNINNTMYYYQQNSQGQYGFADTDGNSYMGDNPFLGDVSYALGNLTSGKTGKDLVDDLIGANKTVNIIEGNDVDQDYSNNTHTEQDGNTIQWDPNHGVNGPDQYGGLYTDPFINLGHEMAHTQDIWNGTIDWGIWAEAEGTNGSTVITPNAEKYAISVENQIRAEHGLPLRIGYTHYLPSPGVWPNNRPVPNTTLIHMLTPWLISNQ